MARCRKRTRQHQGHRTSAPTGRTTITHKRNGTPPCKTISTSRPQGDMVHRSNGSNKPERNASWSRCGPRHRTSPSTGALSTNATCTDQAAIRARLLWCPGIQGRSRQPNAEANPAHAPCERKREPVCHRECMRIWPGPTKTHDDQRLQETARPHLPTNPSQLMGKARPCPSKPKPKCGMGRAVTCIDVRALCPVGPKDKGTALADNLRACRREAATRMQ